MIAGVLPWYLFSNLAFLADMGWMLRGHAIQLHMAMVVLADRSGVHQTQVPRQGEADESLETGTIRYGAR